MNDIFNYEIDCGEVLIVGKGPSMQKAKYAMPGILKVGLNHTDHVDITHQVDWNSACYAHPFVLTPYYPLLNHRPNDVLTPDLPNLHAYNLYCAPRQIGLSPLIYGDGFSIHYVITIFALKGIKRFKLCGIDGGMGYHSSFTHLTPNPQGYDRQFKYIEKLVSEYSLEITTL